MNFTIPLKITSKTAGNSREHWAAKARRVKKQRAAVHVYARAKGDVSEVLLPALVTLTRIAPRELDSHDNLRMGLKPCVDELAVLLGVDDADPRVTWRYAQAKGKPKEYAVRVCIEPVEAYGDAGLEGA